MNARRSPRCRLLVGSIFVGVFCAIGRAEDKKDEKKKEPPKVLTSSAFTLLPGKTQTLKLRGLSLAETSAAKVTTAAGEEIPATVKSKAKSDPPKPFDAARAGDSEVQVELKVPADAAPSGDLALTLTTPAGDTAPLALRVADPATAVEEKEPNGGFKSAQPIALGQTVLGAIQEANDVDVFRLVTAKAGTKIVAEVVAARKGSLLDGALTLYDAAGRVVATADDSAESLRDPVLTVTLPADGTYYLALIDANDHGGGASHAYELTVRESK